MSKPLNEIKAALQTYRNALVANAQNHEDLKLMSLTFEIEQMALKLNEVFLEMPRLDQGVKGVQRVFDVPTPDAELYERFSPASAMYDILMLILKSGAGDIEVNSAQGRVKLSQHYSVVSADRWQYQELLKDGQ